jgi:hypothetical protein
MTTDTATEYRIVDLFESTYYEQNKNDFDDEYDELSFFEGDPDILYFDGEVIAYISIIDSDKEVIAYVTDGDASDRAFTLLNKWIQAPQEFKQTEPNNWASVDRKGYTLAYRGDSGYVYTIFKLS